MNLNPWVIGFLLLIGVIGFVSHYIPQLGGDDNPVEELAESIIKDQTGFDIDLTPSSPEKK